MKNKKGLIPVALSALLHVFIFVVYFQLAVRKKEGQRGECYPLFPDYRENKANTIKDCLSRPNQRTSGAMVGSLIDPKVSPEIIVLTARHPQKFSQHDDLLLWAITPLFCSVDGAFTASCEYISLSPINLLNCFFAEWTRYLHIARIERIERTIDGQAPFSTEPPLKRVFPEMYRGNAINSTIRSILNALTFFKFGATQKGDDNDEQK